VSAVAKVDALGMILHAATSCSVGMADRDTAEELRAARRLVEEVIVEARYVIDNPSPRNLADLRAALERVS
jgi:hypothetical protein